MALDDMPDSQVPCMIRQQFPLTTIGHSRVDPWFASLPVEPGFEKRIFANQLFRTITFVFRLRPGSRRLTSRPCAHPRCRGKWSRRAQDKVATHGMGYQLPPISSILPIRGITVSGDPLVSSVRIHFEDGITSFKKKESRQLKDRATIAIFAALTGLVLPAPGQSPDQASAPMPIATDRPAVTDSSAVVPNRVFQAENGVLDTGNQGGRTIDFPETLIRIGIVSGTELRFTTPDYYLGSPASTGPPSGFGDLVFGIKQQIISVQGGFEIAAVVSLSFPTGADLISSHGYDPSFQAPWSHPLSSNWTAEGMLSVDVPTQNGSHHVIGESTLVLDRQLTKAWDAFTEYVGDFPQSGAPRHLLHFGTAYKITPRRQLDLHVGVGLSAAAVHHFIGLGYSFRFSMGKRQ